MSRIFRLSQPQPHKTAAELFCFASLAAEQRRSRRWRSRRCAPSAPGALGSAARSRHPARAQGSSGGRAAPPPPKNTQDARGLSARIRAGVQTGHLHHKAREGDRARRRPSGILLLSSSALAIRARRHSAKICN